MKSYQKDQPTVIPIVESSFILIEVLSTCRRSSTAKFSTFGTFRVRLKEKMVDLKLSICLRTSMNMMTHSGFRGMTTNTCMNSCRLYLILLIVTVVDL